MLQPLAKSRLYLYKNLINKVYLLELFNDLCFFKDVYEHVFPSTPPKEYKEHLVYSNEDYEGELSWPSQPYIFNDSEIKKIKNHFSATENVVGMRLSVCI